MSIRRVASELKSRLAAWRGTGGERGSYRRFLSGESGAIAIYFGLSAIVFVGVAGLAVDAARGYLVKARLSEAIDAAALAGGKALQTAGDTNSAKVIGDATAFFNANFPNGAMGAKVATPLINVSNNNTTVTVSSNAVIPTTLMSVLGFKNMTMVASATVARAQGGLDVVFSFDVSGSMSGSKIQALRDNATALVTSMFKPFTSGGQSQIVNVSGTDYSLLNIGIVPWNSKVNVRTHGKEGSTGTVSTQTVTTYTDPTKRYSGNKTVVYYATSSEVPLLYDPSNSSQVQGGWTGCVYARYTDDGDQTNDADLLRGSVTVGASNTKWPGWVPIARDEGEDQSFSSCDAADWNQGKANATDGTPRPGGWPTSAQLNPKWGFSSECSFCPTVGILPLQRDETAVKSMISSLTAGGATDAPQGLFWAWEVLMPGAPFDQAVMSPPFQRSQAIVFMTDGFNEGANGDAYHGWFGDNGVRGSAGWTTAKGDMTMSDGSTAKNNLNNRLLSLATTIKGSNPADPSAVKIYVIQYDETDATLTTLLKAVATEPQAPYYYQADKSNLSNVFDEIAKSLTALRIVK